MTPVVLATASEAVGARGSQLLWFSWRERFQLGTRRCARWQCHDLAEQVVQFLVGAQDATTPQATGARLGR